MYALLSLPTHAGFYMIIIWFGIVSARSVRGSPISVYVLICQENMFPPSLSLSPFPFTVCSGSSCKLSHRNTQSYSHNVLWLSHVGWVQCQPESPVLWIPGQTSLAGGRNTLSPTLSSITSPAIPFLGLYNLEWDEWFVPTKCRWFIVLILF